MAPKPLVDLKRRAGVSAIAGGAAVAGLVAGTALGARLRTQRRPHLLGVPMPSGSELKSGARQAAQAGRWLSDAQADVRALRAQAEQSRRQSPIEVVLTALTARSLPRRDPAGP
jgi:hypothetical protein